MLIICSAPCNLYEMQAVNPRISKWALRVYKTCLKNHVQDSLHLNPRRGVCVCVCVCVSLHQ
jgi:hypothetical protein